MLSRIQTKAYFKMYPEVVLASQQISAIEQQRNAKNKTLFTGFLGELLLMNMRSQKTKKEERTNVSTFSQNVQN